MSKKCIFVLCGLLILSVFLILLNGCGSGSKNSMTVPVRVAEKPSKSSPNQVNYDSLLAQINALIAQVESLDSALFKNGESGKNTLLNKLNAVQNQINAGASINGILGALNEILGKLNGCAGNPAGGPDPNDLITDCPTQIIIEDITEDLITSTECGGFASVEISTSAPTPVTIKVNEKIDFIASSSYTNPACPAKDVTQKVNWISSAPTTAEFIPTDPAGRLTGKIAGSTSIMANLYGITSNSIEVIVQLAVGVMIDKAPEELDLSLSYDGINYFLSRTGMRIVDGQIYMDLVMLPVGVGFMNQSTEEPISIPNNIPVDGSKNIYVYLITVSGGPIPPNTHWTLYSDLEPQNFLQLMKNVAKTGISISIDAHANAFSTSTPGVPRGVYTPVALPTPSLGGWEISCAAISERGNLIWDGSQYLASNTPLSFQDRIFDNIPNICKGVYYLSRSNGEIKVCDDNTPVSGFNGTNNLNVALLSSDSDNRAYYTDLTKEEFKNTFPLTLIKWLPDIFISQGYGQNYIWNDSALTADPYFNFVSDATFETVVDNLDNLDKWAHL